jgi:serine protease Do
METRMSAVPEIQELVAQAAERLGPAVVGIGPGWGRGTGVLVAPGRVLTAARAVRGEEVTLTTSSGERRPGRVAGRDLDVDVAVILADLGDVAPVAWDPGLPAPGVGAPVLALSNPGGRGLRVTLGQVASAGRRYRGPRGRWVPGAIEHTAPAPPGSAGGPLVDVDGRLVGLNLVRLDGGFILAAPADADLAARVERLARGEARPSRRLGVAIAPPRAARRLRRAVGLPERDGLLVRQVEPGSPAERAGLATGDLIVAVDGHPAESVDAVYAALDRPETDSLRLTVVRGLDEREVGVALGAER